MGKLLLIIKLLYFTLILNSAMAKNLTATRFVVKLENYGNVQYYGKLLVGSETTSNSDQNKNSFNFVFSTGSTLSWLPGDICHNCRNNTNKYISNNAELILKSRNQSGIAFKYSTADITGNYALDTFHIIDQQKQIQNYAKLKDYKFLLVNNEHDSLQYVKADGVIGLGLFDQKDTNFVNELYRKGIISAPKFSFYFSSGSFLDSKLYLGDFYYNTPISPVYKQLNYCKVSSNLNKWGCEINSIHIGKTILPIVSNLIIDTGSTNVVVPISDFKIIKKYVLDSVHAECVRSETNQLLCKCDSPNIFPNIKLYVGPQKNLFEIKTLDLIEYSPSVHYQCRFHILVEMDNLDTWTIGTAAMKNLFLSFDIATKKIGFSQNPKNIEAYVNQPYVVDIEPQDSNKIGYIFTLFFLFLTMFFIYRCADNENFMNRSNSFGNDDQDDYKKMELVKNQFNNDEYDYDFNLDTKNKSKYVEMKELKTKEINFIEK